MGVAGESSSLEWRREHEGCASVRKMIRADSNFMLSLERAVDRSGSSPFGAGMKGDANSDDDFTLRPRPVSSADAEPGVRAKTNR
jgi:hypothetical protein